MVGSRRDPRRHMRAPGRGAAVLAAPCRHSAATEQRHDGGRARHKAAYVARLVTIVLDPFYDRVLTGTLRPHTLTTPYWHCSSILVPSCAQSALLLPLHGHDVSLCRASSGPMNDIAEEAILCSIPCCRGATAALWQSTAVWCGIFLASPTFSPAADLERVLPCPSAQARHALHQVLRRTQVVWIPFPSYGERCRFNEFRSPQPTCAFVVAASGLLLCRTCLAARCGPFRSTHI